MGSYGSIAGRSLCVSWTDEIQQIHLLIVAASPRAHIRPATRYAPEKRLADFFAIVALALSALLSQEMSLSCSGESSLSVGLGRVLRLSFPFDVDDDEAAKKVA